jgi:Rod binding domain-containing protein
VDTLPVLPTTLPAEVRDASPKSQELYRAALGFETLLVKQLTSALSQASTGTGIGGDDGGDEGGNAVSGMYGQMLPDALADSLQQSGGLGFALDVWRSAGGKELK